MSVPDSLVKIPHFSCRKPFFLQQSKPKSSLIADSQKGEDDSIGCLDIFSISRLGVPSPCRQKQNQCKKELESFIQAKFEDYDPGRHSQKAPRTVLLIRSQDAVHISFLKQRTVHEIDMLLTVYTIQI